MQQTQLNQIMPLLAPVYKQEFLNNNLALNTRIQAKCFDAETNRLSELLLKDSSSNYNAWYAKKMYILTHSPDLKREQEFTHNSLGEKGKSFQVWEQKRFLSQITNQFENQLKLMRAVFAKDAKNYHAWSLRIWLVENIGRFEQQLNFADQMIEKDCFNNSAWSYRFFLVGKIVNDQHCSAEKRKDRLDKEIKYTLEKIEPYQSNKAAWNYLRGFFPSLQLKGIPSQNSVTKILIPSYKQYPEIMNLCRTWWEDLKTKRQNANGKNEGLLFQIEREVLTTLIHIHAESLDQLQFAKNICLQLSQKDRQRVFYWKWIYQHLGP